MNDRYVKKIIPRVRISNIREKLTRKTILTEHSWMHLTFSNLKPPKSPGERFIFICPSDFSSWKPKSFLKLHEAQINFQNEF